MICLSKADESVFRHLTWNQSPSPLAAQHTTRQDLNGIANTREHVEADQDDGSGGLGGPSSNASEGNIGLENQPPGLCEKQLADAGRLSRSSGSFSRRKMVDGGDAHDHLFRGASSSCLERIWSWAVWLLSVLLVSTLLTYWNSRSSVPSSSKTLPQQSPAPAMESRLRKRDSCSTGGVASDYNLGLHVMALFLILCVSTLACAFPIMARKFPFLRIPSRFFFAVRHFGTGVLIATAFVHLLPTAFISLGNPCLSGFWTQDYPAMPGAIALAAIFLVTTVEMIFHPSRQMPPPAAPQAAGAAASHGGSCMGAAHMFDMAPSRGRSTSIGQGLFQLNSRNDMPQGPVAEEAIVEETEETRRKESFENPSLESLQATALSPEQQQRKELLQCVLLELGILFHSIFIGMALSVTVHNEFIILLIAIVFHQTFEGLALGSRISAIKWPQGKMQPWFMALAYGCTTPIGQAIGIATHTLYSPDSQIGLIVVGVMNAISSGLLTYASLVELLSEDFLSDESWRHLRGKKRVVACLLVFFGAFFMSLVGAWA